MYIGDHFLSHMVVSIVPAWLIILIIRAIVGHTADWRNQDSQIKQPG